MFDYCDNRGIEKLIQPQVTRMVSREQLTMATAAIPMSLLSTPYSCNTWHPIVAGNVRVRVRRRVRIAHG